MSYAIVFPGQGAQEVGMGRDFHDAYGVSRDAFREADAALGFSLSNIIFEGPEDELVQTALTQPALLTASIAIMRAFAQELGQPVAPAFYAGHSLGEYTALVASGVISLGDAVKLVHKRGSLMQQAVPVGKGAMAAVLGLDKKAIETVCAEAAQGEIVSAANVNAPTQIVISGDAAAVERAGALAKEKGASKVIPLKVSAPFHCELMRPVADKLRAEFPNIAWSAPQVPIAANVDATFVNSVDGIQQALYAQTYSPVLWSEGVEAMAASGVDTFIEFGPGNVLSGLIKRIAKGSRTAAVSKTADMDKALSLLRETA